MYPVLLRLGPLEIKSYGVMLAISFLLGYLVAQKRAARNGIDVTVLLDLCFYILISAIAGSRAFYVVTHWEEYSAHPLSALSIWEGGLSMMGGVLLGLAVSWLFLKKKGVSFTRMADTLAPSIALGVGLTRIGCFLYGCCYGLPSDVSWAIHFPPNSAAGSHFHEAIHPTQLYSSAYGFIIFLVLLLIEKMRPPSGVVFASLLLLYAAARFTIDFYRYYEPEQIIVHSPVALTNNQVICAVLFIFGLGLLIWSYRRRTAGA
ncbi:MAG: prolipoprotein diacylglyceryl transferase [Candidatus Glassbacteria bacterium RIFCSPLOWO2_12_FULL_58_11]|uniref:Phosphatidylglycerol--prolipoprotein diacylglyceryl transferase n=1 Tax=Candidatus Glassbacteria bacterium RIFCSPLOWO2_12_FULL_58_11 TaxID=1817867 RepID=A0A1F5YZ49_9BACT|nr:MAG: prolipoprotein diacylglyceryl transferase [Candidatus Glassbacteria bacterium RIFCSPLOWO2_12_FULL_58_11]